MANNKEPSREKPNDPGRSELNRFAFLIGKWKGEARLKQDTGTWERFEATWEGRYMADGHAIADEYRMTTLEGRLLVLGVNVRAYDSQRKAWSMKWLDALAGTWTDLGPGELGGVRADDQGITYSMREPVAQHALTRATYSNITPDGFIWRGERTNDRETWEEFMVIELHRVEASP